MKKIVLLLVLICIASFGIASTGWFSDFVLINGEVGPDNYYWIGANPSYGSELNGHDFGTVTTLTIEGCDMKYWSDNQDRTGGAFYWRIDEGTATEVVWNHASIGGNDYQGTLSGQGINVLNGLSAGTYTLQIWAKSWGTSQGDDWLNNGGSNYVASFTIAEVPLPVCLSTFTAKALNGTVVLDWVTASETENSHFLVYRDGEVIAQVDGAGTTSETNSYSVTDAQVLPGVHEYALADVTYGGVEKMHDAVTVEVGAAIADASFKLNKAYPNPFNPRTAISFQLSAVSNMDLSIYSMGGEKIATLYSGEQTAGQHQILWNAAGYPSGIYVVKLLVGEMMQTQKIVLMK